MTLAAIVLAAGRGNRLRPLTDATPKPLLPIGDSTLLDETLERISAVVPISPMTVTVNAHWLAEQLVDHVGEQVHVSVEQPEALGTAGAIGAIQDWRDGRDLLVANSDAWFGGGLDLPAFVAGWDGERARLLVVEDLERPDFDARWRFAGMSLLPAAAAAGLRPVPSGLYEAVWRDAERRRELDLAPTTATFIDCGTPADYERALLTARRSADPG